MFLKCLPQPKESKCQVDFVKYARTYLRDKGHLLFAIPNGGTRNIKEAQQLKNQGVVSGVPDLFLAIPKGIYHGLFIEMKRDSKCKLSDNQAEMIELLKSQGYAVEVCLGFSEAVEAFHKYMK